MRAAGGIDLAARSSRARPAARSKSAARNGPAELVASNEIRAAQGEFLDKEQLGELVLAMPEVGQ
ncbi:hypothetical protein CFP66_46515 [Pseudonocardia sp. MH-G8]|nr:hypothetical protein CFP66_46515 [Pseudonocardia sp. MH-G8]